MNLARYFQLALPFLALFLQALRITGNEKAGEFALETEKYINAGQAFVTELGSKVSTVIKGTSAISEYGENIIAQINAVKASSLDKAQKIAEATRLAATLSDKKIVYQPKKGDDFIALNEYKAKALNLVNDLTR